MCGTVCPPPARPWSGVKALGGRVEELPEKNTCKLGVKDDKLMSVTWTGGWIRGEGRRGGGGGCRN